MGFPLPDELTGLTFDHLDVPSLLRCMQVCKLFHSIISESTHLSYKIELFASYMEDNENSSMDTLSRLSLLREYNQVWNETKWTSYGSIPMCQGHCWEFSGGILAQSTHENEIFFVQLPCKLKGIVERRWSVPFDFTIRDFTLDNSQDLVVLLELAGNVPNMSCKIHLRTLSGVHHPGTAVAHITHASESLHAELSFLMQICGNHLAILFYDQSGPSTPNSFLVWDWRTGHREVCIRIPEFQSFAFMTEGLILAGILRSHREPALQVLSIATNPNPIYSLEDISYVCELRYPRLQGSTEYFLIRSEPTPTWRPPAGSGIPFYCSRKDSIFSICVRNMLGEVHGSTVLLVPLSMLLSEVERSRDVPRRTVAWNTWGPGGTRLVFREPSETWVCYTYGMRFIQGLQWKGGHVARAYDFNPYAARMHVKTSVDSPTVWKRLAKQSLPNVRYEIFDDEVTTELPGRVANLTLHHLEEGWDAVMIGEDHILMVQPICSTYGYMAM